MGEYVDIGGLKTWYDTVGEGDPLVLLHGGLCTNDTWGSQMAAFGERFRVLAPERRAHGHTPDVDGPLTYRDMVADTIGFLDAVVNGPAHVVGWSDGAIVGLLVASERPDLVRKFVAISANLSVEPGVMVPGADEGLQSASDDPSLEMFRGLYAVSSPDGAEHWPVMYAKFTEMVTAGPGITAQELACITAPTLVMSGDDDMVTLEHTLEIYRGISNSELAVLPGTSHALVFEKADLLNRLVLDFLSNEPVATMMPFRRAANAHG
jgi:pimeloyl-ACP methyl ester carboxylesterase